MANRTYSVRHFVWRTSVLAVASSLVLAGMPQSALAAGLGRLVVFSALGQPLKAEIEVTATREELISMNARLASPETFKQAGLDYGMALLSVRFNLERQPGGGAIIKLSSERPINDPFLDMLLELNWSTGRLVREYTFLLDPPEYTAKTPPAPTAPAASTPTVSSAPGVGTPPPAGGPAGSASSSIDSAVRARAIAQVQTAGQAAQRPAASMPPAGEKHEVKRGETLHRIAAEMQLEGVSLEQMLVGLFRANPGAFDGKNMNRLRTGAILSMPERSSLESVSAREARRIVVAQSSNWNAYRSRLAGVAAGSPAQGDAAKQASGGKITAKVDDESERTVPGDQLKVSNTDSASGKGGVQTGNVSAEDVIANDRALREANERVTALEKIRGDQEALIEQQRQEIDRLKKLSLENPKLAEAESSASQFPTQPPSSPVPADASPPVTATAPPSAAQASEPMPQPETTPPPVSATQASEPMPQPREQPTQPVKPRAEPPLPVEEPGFFDELLGNPIVLAGGGVIAVLIGGLFFWRRRRANAEMELDLGATLTPEDTATSVMGNSVFRNTAGGQSIDTSSSQALSQSDFSQVGPGSIDTDEVDPVAEADVYMAYGRDVQAEEILLEALQKDPKRTAIIVKLLEVYSGRKNVKQFEALADQLQSETGGVGPDWEKAVAMRRLLLEPGNQAVSAAAAVVTGAIAAKPPVTQASPQAVPLKSPAEPIDIRLPEETKLKIPEAAAAKAQEMDLDFDIGTRIVPMTEMPDPQETKAQKPNLDFDLGAATLAPSDRGKTGGEGGKVDTEAEARIARPQAALEDDAVEFNVSLTESTFLNRAAPEPSFDMTSIDLDLHSPDLDIAGVDGQTLSADTGKAPPQGKAIEEYAPRETQITTAINPDFASQHTETIITPPSQSSTLVNPNFTAEHTETQVVPEISATQTAFVANQQAETVVSPLSGIEKQSLAPELDVDSNEEAAATKLDLAKAYEEMGDIEGARELLQEVLNEGSASQREAARNALTRVDG